ncbi:MAG TPA: hypothetical protein VHY48_05510 [Acidobacteriaceae bacterium]|jgi:hypothetical protein|nr:hypothetical protein [Acidobacteriaceae bacterium]
MRLLRSYLFWTYERGSLHYDVMVTLILLFLFLAPRFIDFKDRPAPDVALRSHEVLVRNDGQTAQAQRVIYTVRAADVNGATGPALQSAALNIIQPIVGPVTIQRIDPVKDTRGQVVAYDVTVLR